ncbi:MAG: hypothetical protein GEV07_04650 [Streptosporangiales bacterium]|nr:hypothetical protein [Streptosporangiales bacterium]
MITYEKLRTLQPQVFNSVGTDLHEAADHQLSGRPPYDTEVVAPARSGEVWKGPGHYEANMVLSTMSLAFDTAGTIMDAAATASVTLAVELTAAKQAAQKIAAEADGYYLYVKPDGELWPKPEIHDDPTNPVGTHAREQQQAILGKHRLQPFMDAALERANNADRRCSNLLQRLDTELHIMVRADATIAARADAANDYAYELFGESVLLLRGLQEDATARHQQAVDDAEPILNDLLDFLGSLVGVDQLKEGDVLGFLGVNATWFIPFGKAGQLLGKAGRAAVNGTRTAGRVAARTRRAFGTTGRNARAERGQYPKVPAGPAAAPKRAVDIRDHIVKHNGSPPPGIKGGKTYKNDPKKLRHDEHPNNPLGETLPRRHWENGEPVKYKEYDVNAKSVGRDDERVVIGYIERNGKEVPVSSWYSKDHYQTFVPMD